MQRETPKSEEPFPNWVTESSVQETIRTSSSTPLSASVAGVLYRRTLFAPISFELHCLWNHLSSHLCRWKNAFWRHQARKRSLNAIGFPLVIGDQCFRRMPDGSLQDVTRTIARTLDTQ